MSKYLTNISMQHIFDSWKDSGLISDTSDQNIKDFILQENEDDNTPLYLKILSAIGAFLATIFLCGFLSVIKIIDWTNHTNMLIVGIGCICLAVVAGRNHDKNSSSVAQTFLLQSSVCLMGLGKILFILGFSYFFKNSHFDEWAISYSAIFITMITYYIYPNSIDRFLSSLFVLISVLVNLDLEYLIKDVPINDSYFLAFQIILAGFLFTYAKVRRIYTPLAYALVFSIFSTIALETYINHQLNLQALKLANLTLTLSLIYLIIWVTADIQKIKSEPVIIAIFGAIFLGIASDPGVIFSICILILGYAKHDKVLLTLGVLAMILSLIFYYYSLNLTLLSKSLVLIGSGLILLVGRYYLHFRKLDQEIV